MLLDGEIHPNDWIQAARLIALLTQAEGVKHSADLAAPNNQKLIQKLSQRAQRVRKVCRKTFVDEMKADNVESENSHAEKFIIENYLEQMMMPDDPETLITRTELPDDFFLIVAREHQRINSMTASSAKYWLLEEFATLRKFGTESFDGTLISELNCNSKGSQPRNDAIQIAVSPVGLSVRRRSSTDIESFSIPFSAVESAKSLRRCFHLCYLDEDFVVSNLVVKFPSHRSAGTLYRSLTEKHAFYSCETVHKNVEKQFIRDLKVSVAIYFYHSLLSKTVFFKYQGTIISMFNEDSELGKKYVFDIRLTFRELYDNSRRILHARGIDVVAAPAQHHQEDRDLSSNDSDAKRIDLTCTICMDNNVEVLFLPCAHLSCCRSCGKK